MSTTTKSLTELTAEDVMVRDLVPLQENMPLRDAARLLIKNQIGGAPVVDAEGRCVGVLSAIDFLRLAERRVDVTKPATPPLPITCNFQTKTRTIDGREVIMCTLAQGACPMQVMQQGEDGNDMLVCTEPRSVLVDWQVAELEKLPRDSVSRYMTRDPVTVTPETSIRDLARMMMDAHIHRVIVVNADRQPTGIVTSTDLLAVLANAS
jgi:CBS domain-containing protein